MLSQMQHIQKTTTKEALQETSEGQREEAQN